MTPYQYPPTYYDEDYVGPRWRYALTHRPAMIGTLPKGRIVGADKPHAEYPFGTVEYPRELTEAEIYTYELDVLGQVQTPDPTPAEDREALLAARRTHLESCRADVVGDYGEAAYDEWCAEVEGGRHDWSLPPAAQAAARRAGLFGRRAW